MAEAAITADNDPHADFTTEFWDLACAVLSEPDTELPRLRLFYARRTPDTCVACNSGTPAETTENTRTRIREPVPSHLCKRCLQKGGAYRYEAPLTPEARTRFVFFRRLEPEMLLELARVNDIDQMREWSRRVGVDYLMQWLGAHRKTRLIIQDRLTSLTVVFLVAGKIRAAETLVRVFRCNVTHVVLVSGENKMYRGHSFLHFGGLPRSTMGAPFLFYC